MANRVRQLREAQHLGVDELATKAAVTSRCLLALEEDACSVGVEAALRIARALNTTVETLFGGGETDSVSTADDEVFVESKAKVDGVDAVEEKICGETAFVSENAAVVEEENAGAAAERKTPKKRCASEKKNSIPKTRRPKENAGKLEESKPAIAPYSTELTQKTLDELFDDEEILRSSSTPKCESQPSILWEESFDPKEVEASRLVFAPRNSRKISSTTSKTAEKEGLADAPEGLCDPTSLRPVRYFDLFCGIGGFRFAAQNVFDAMRRDSECVLSCDIDPPARKSYAENFGETPFGDVARLPSEEIPDFDLLFAGFPCQTFSIIGLRKGFSDETKGSLFFQIARILKDKRPRAFVLENVRQLTTHDNGRTFEIILRVLQEELGYHVDWRVLNALDCGLPQKRERVVVVGCVDPFVMEWPRQKSDPKTLSDILEDDNVVDKKYFASPEIVAKRKAAHRSDYFPAVWHENKSGNISSYPYSCALRAGASYNYLLVNGERRFTPREMLRLQGFPDEFKIVVSDTQIRKQAGNAAPVNLIQAALERFLPLVFEKK